MIYNVVLPDPLVVHEAFHWMTTSKIPSAVEQHFRLASIFRKDVLIMVRVYKEILLYPNALLFGGGKSLEIE